jgi:nickel-dependent lactate racemase
LKVRYRNEEIEIPDSSVVEKISGRALESIPDVHGAVKDVLENPIGTDSVTDLVDSNSTVAIAVDSWERPTPTYKIMAPLLEVLHSRGVKEENVWIVVGNGVHSPLNAHKTERQVSSEVARRYRIIQHDRFCLPRFGGDQRFEQNYRLEFIGFSSYGNPIWINSEFLKADFKITIGIVGVNPMSGYSGSGKKIIPGVAGYDTINRNHNMSLAPDPWYGTEENNPVRAEMNEAGKMAGLNFAISLICSGRSYGAPGVMEIDYDRVRIVDVVAGDPTESHKEAIERYKKHHGNPRVIKEKADITIALNPADMNAFHNMGWTLPNTGITTKAGGSVIYVSECNDGFFCPGCLDIRICQGYFLHNKDNEEVLKEIAEGTLPGWEGPIVYWVNKTKRKSKQFIWVNSDRPKSLPMDLKNSDLITMGYIPETSLRRAYQKAMEVQGKGAKVTILDPAATPILAEGQFSRQLDS